ncbi:hypothetical protein NKH80_15530 [Mesorhizobium sp. M0904]|uniref:hypothetical protein n=1 Tax=Mesorhizobium sp. M0904 TaxID=2957022 RepID=UPI0033360B78
MIRDLLHGLNIHGDVKPVDDVGVGFGIARGNRLRISQRCRNFLLSVHPNIRETILIEFVTRLGYAFFSIATLSFLGLGIQPPSADWGLAVADGYGFLTGGKWWVVVFNSGAIVSLVVATNLIAQGIGAFENVDG